MVGTKRTPLARHPTMLVTPLAVELFVQQGRLRCSCNGCGSCASCDEWYRLIPTSTLNLASRRTSGPPPPVRVREAVARRVTTKIPLGAWSY